MKIRDIVELALLYIGIPAITLYLPSDEVKVVRDQDCTSLQIQDGRPDDHGRRGRNL